MYIIYVFNNEWKKVCGVDTLKKVIEVLDGIGIERYIVKKHTDKGDDFVSEDEIEKARLEYNNLIMPTNYIRYDKQSDRYEYYDGLGNRFTFNDILDLDNNKIKKKRK